MPNTFFHYTHDENDSRSSIGIGAVNVNESASCTGLDRYSALSIRMGRQKEEKDNFRFFP